MAREVWIAGKQRSRTFGRKSDARTFDADVTRRRSSARRLPPSSTARR